MMGVGSTTVDVAVVQVGLLQEIILMMRVGSTTVDRSGGFGVG